MIAERVETWRAPCWAAWAELGPCWQSKMIRTKMEDKMGLQGNTQALSGKGISHKKAKTKMKPEDKIQVTLASSLGS